MKANKHSIFVLIITLVISFQFTYADAVKDTLLISSSNRQGQPIDRSRKELKSKRNYFSKSYLNSDGTITTEISSGYVHYKDEDGSFKEIDRNFKKNRENNSLEINHGLYIAGISTVSKVYPVVFRTRDGYEFKSQMLSLGYYDTNNKSFKEIASYNPDSICADGNRVTCFNAFPGIDIVYEYRDTKLKEFIVLTEEARKRLDSPGDHGILFDKALLAIKVKFDSNDELDVYLGKMKISNRKYMARSQRNKTIFDRPQEASGKINFCNSAGQMKYGLLEDVAFLKDSSEYKPVNDSHLSHMQRIIYSIEDENYILSGVPYKWLASYTDGTIILDPTVTIQPSTDDVWIEYNRSTNYNSYTSIRIGRQSSYGWKRSLVKFDLSSIPAGADIISSTMSLRWYGCYGTYKIDRLIKCHQVLKDWNESQATWFNRLTGTAWGTSGVGLDDVDAKSTAEDSLIWGTSGYPAWKNYNLSSLTQKWIDGEEDNHGVILWATNESQYTNMDEKRCNSSESTTASYRPKLIVTYTTTKNIATYSYDEKGRVRSVSYGNGMTEENTYDANRGWLLSKTYSKSGIIKFRAYNRTYDDVGNLTYSKENEHLSYYYDDYYRLESVDYEERTKYYSYDENGNLTSIRGSSIPVNSSDNKMNVAGYAYDANGNMTTHNGNTVTYDWRNMMTGYNSNTYTYDAFGERVRKYENSQYHYYITSGMNILEEYNHDQSLAVMHIYNGIERIASIIPGDDMYYACSDNVMSARALVDESGNKDQARDFYPYGEIYYAYGDKTKYQFSGKELDATGLYYFGARYYDPGIGRWLSCDPAGQFHSPYSYCGGNPVIYVDPDGEWVLIVALAIAGAYCGGYITNDNLDPTEWDYQDADTWIGMGIGVAVGVTLGYGIGAALAGHGLTIGFEVQGVQFDLFTIGGSSAGDASAALAGAASGGGSIAYGASIENKLNQAASGNDDTNFSIPDYTFADYFSEPTTWASNLKGTKYQWGGNTPSTGFDCSGFVNYLDGISGIHRERGTANSFPWGFGWERVNGDYSTWQTGDHLQWVIYPPPGHIGFWDAGRQGMWHSRGSKGVSFDKYGSGYWNWIIGTYGNPIVWRFTGLKFRTKL